MMKSKTFLIGLVGGVCAVALIGGCELIASVNHDDIKDSSSAASTTGTGGGSSSSASTSGSTTASVSSSSSSSSASSSTGGCTDATTCLQPAAQCEEATCIGMMCGVADKMSGEACNEGTGTKCDGVGNCVDCLTNADCTDTPATPVCNIAGNICVSASCADGMKNGNETDIDCGGDGASMCADCPVTKICTGPTDCLSGFCQPANPPGMPDKTCAACASDSNCANNEFCDSLTAGGTCVLKKANGQNCAANNQCTNAHCVGTGLKVCCDQACNTECLSCFAAEKASGVGDGACGPATALSNPNGLCVATECRKATCDGTTAAGKCEVQPASAQCGQMDTCSNSQFTSQQHCTGTTDTCPGPVAPQDCPSNLACQDAVDCATACTFNNSAAPNGTSTGCASGFYCENPGSGNVCVGKKILTSACTQNYECLSNNCDNPGTLICVP